MVKDLLGSTLNLRLNLRQIIRLFLRVFGEIRELVDMWPLMTSLFMKESAQVSTRALDDRRAYSMMRALISYTGA